ncbi:hypothetical protein D641_0101400 [Brachybacterium muris UCD-AY4]|uniref:Uncharacterized protein n=1 Tax=Brachybacterium muris UCD-AY4 TaxID=1249481 RepID=A0A022L580_9MICO|nr:hypothetical protein D641_0101400 [Brachybacterium muris UCD-AY4]
MRWRRYCTRRRAPRTVRSSRRSASHRGWKGSFSPSSSPHCWCCCWWTWPVACAASRRPHVSRSGTKGRTPRTLARLTRSPRTARPHASSPRATSRARRPRTAERRHGSALSG